MRRAVQAAAGAVLVVVVRTGCAEGQGLVGARQRPEQRRDEELAVAQARRGREWWAVTALAGKRLRG